MGCHASTTVEEEKESIAKNGAKMLLQPEHVAPGPEPKKGKAKSAAAAPVSAVPMQGEWQMKALADDEPAFRTRACGQVGNKDLGTTTIPWSNIV